MTTQKMTPALLKEQVAVLITRAVSSNIPLAKIYETIEDEMVALSGEMISAKHEREADIYPAHYEKRLIDGRWQETLVQTAETLTPQPGTWK